MLSKTLAEQAAWKFAEENAIDLVTINPGFTIGPFLQKSPGLTVEEVLRMIKGKTLIVVLFHLSCLAVKNDLVKSCRLMQSDIILMLLKVLI